MEWSGLEPSTPSAALNPYRASPGPTGQEACPTGFRGIRANSNNPLHSLTLGGVMIEKLMRICLVLALAATLQGAAIRGTVMENQTGHFLARAVVGIEPAPGSAGPRLSTRTNANGIFEFANLPAGSYVVTAVRRSFASVEYGQRQWRAAGLPLVVKENDTANLSIRLPRLGAIAGTLFDENDVGLPDHDVAIYTDTRPPALITKARTDDRGVYRFFGLNPGSYLIRTATKSDEDAAWLPTFYKDVANLDLAIPIEVALDQQVDNVNLHPTMGRLYSIGGRTYAPISGGEMTVMLVSDMGTEFADIDSRGNFHFNPAAPGQYEVQAVSNTNRGAFALYQSLSLDHDTTGLLLAMTSFPTLQFVFEDTKGAPVDARSFQVMLRHKDLAGTGKVETMRPGGGRAPVLPGRYDVTLMPGPAWYVVSVSGARPEGVEEGRADGWNEILLAPNSSNTLKFVVSSTPGAVHGVVRDTSGAPVAGIPVFLEAYDLERRKRLKDFQILRTDVNGQYHFIGLAPGAYRLLATFDFRTPDGPVMELPVVKMVRVDENHDVIQDLDQYIVR